MIRKEKSIIIDKSGSQIGLWKLCIFSQSKIKDPEHNFQLKDSYPDIHLTSLAKMYLDAQNIKLFWYRASVLEFLLIAHAHFTTHDHTNSSTYIWYTESCTLTRNSHLMAKTSLTCISMCFFIFWYYNWLLYFPINKKIFLEKKNYKNPLLTLPPHPKNWLRYALWPVNWLCAHPPSLSSSCHLFFLWISRN